MHNPIRGKRKARKLAMQALYQWLITKQNLTEIELQFCQANNIEKIDLNYFHQLLYGVPAHLVFLETKLTPLLDRPIQELNPVESSILRLASFELFYCPEIPFRVVLDEAISLAKEFGSQDGHRYVNGVLNNLAKIARVQEIGAN